MGWSGMICAGGYLLKGSSISELSKAIQIVCGGAMIMAESAVQETDNGQTGQSRMFTAQREINIFLNKS